MEPVDRETWTAFRNEISDLRTAACDRFIKRWPKSMQSEAEEEFYLLCMRFQMNAQENLRETESSFNGSDCIAWHVVAGSTGITFDNAPQLDLPGEYSLKSLLLSVVDGTNPQFLPPSSKTKAKRPGATRRVSSKVPAPKR